ncbi:hypothetical protein C1J02_12995 [Sulfitobacter sp. SK011]|jgi:endonuclease/exonuclease/phosphatase (EEP) superfamily protein YafD|nr:hypothetical protein C1J02_12995 [Sulfitobacter sp. SK011]
MVGRNSLETGHMVRKAFLGLISIAALLVIVGYLGQFHRGADTVAIGRPVFGIICILGIFVARSLTLRFAFGTIALLAISTVAVSFLPQKSGGDIRVYSKNLWFGNKEFSAVVADIEAANVDVVMLQEVSVHNNPALQQLKAEFPHQYVCRFSRWSGIALASRLPFDGDPICSDSRAVLAAPILLKGQRVWVASAHIPWPWPHDSSENEKDAISLLSELDGPVIVAGDFNIVPWSGRVGRIAALTGTQLAGPARATLHLRNIPLPIDMVLAPGGGSLEMRPLLGSDHAGLVADLVLWPK